MTNLGAMLIKEGFENGVKDGKSEKAIEIAKNALKENASIDFIQRITNLDIETIKKLQQEIK